MVILMPNTKDCTIEVLILGCRDLSGSAKAPFVEVDIGDPANKGVKVSSKPSKLPEAANPNFGEVLKLNIRLPEDPLFMPTVSVRVKDKTRSGEERIGTCSINLVKYMPLWEAVAAARITKMRQGQLKRRWLKEVLAVRRIQKMWRAKKFKMAWAGAMRDARRAQGLSEEEPLLPRSSSLSRATSLARRRIKVGVSTNDVSLDMPAPLPQQAHTRSTEWLTTEPRVRRYKKRKDGNGLVMLVKEDTPTKTYHQMDSGE